MTGGRLSIRCRPSISPIRSGSSRTDGSCSRPGGGVVPAVLAEAELALDGDQICCSRVVGTAGHSAHRRAWRWRRTSSVVPDVVGQADDVAIGMFHGFAPSWKKRRAPARQSRAVAGARVVVRIDAEQLRPVDLRGRGADPIPLLQDVVAGHGLSVDPDEVVAGSASGTCWRKNFSTVVSAATST